MGTVGVVQRFRDLSLGDRGLVKLHYRIGKLPGSERAQSTQHGRGRSPLQPCIVPPSFGPGPRPQPRKPPQLSSRSDDPNMPLCLVPFSGAQAPPDRPRGPIGRPGNQRYESAGPSRDLRYHPAGPPMRMGEGDADGVRNRASETRLVLVHSVS